MTPQPLQEDLNPTVWDEFGWLFDWGALTRFVCVCGSHLWDFWTSLTWFCELKHFCQRTSFQPEQIMKIQTSNLCGMSLHRTMSCMILICVKNTNYCTKATRWLVQKQAHWQCSYFKKKNQSSSKPGFLYLFFPPITPPPKKKTNVLSVLLGFHGR